MRYFSPVIITIWASEFPAAFDSACIIYRVSRLCFSASVESRTSLNNIGGTANLALPVTVVAVVLDSFMVLVVAVALT